MALNEIKNKLNLQANASSLAKVKAINDELSNNEFGKVLIKVGIFAIGNTGSNIIDSIITSNYLLSNSYLFFTNKQILETTKTIEQNRI
jgi:cell division GTPase FtsZ